MIQLQKREGVELLPGPVCAGWCVIGRTVDPRADVVGGETLERIKPIQDKATKRKITPGERPQSFPPSLAGGGDGRWKTLGLSAATTLPVAPLPVTVLGSSSPPLVEESSDTHDFIRALSRLGGQWGVELQLAGHRAP